ncbi:MAG: histidine phosphatase family protein [Betaproteobacteria bacterium]
MKTTLILIRHGETLWNREGRIQGHLDSALTSDGIAQAEACARRLQGESIDHVIASDLPRVRHTADILNASTNLPIRFEPALRERCYGVGEGRTYAELDAMHPEMYSSIRATDPDFTFEGGESRRQFHGRVTDVLRLIAERHAGSRVLVVTHGGVLAVVYRWLNKMPIATSHKVEIPNVAYNRITVWDGAWNVEVWADSSHLPMETFAVG